jgi:hypothetical protein
MTQKTKPDLLAFLILRTVALALGQTYGPYFRWKSKKYDQQRGTTDGANGSKSRGSPLPMNSVVGLFPGRPSRARPSGARNRNDFDRSVVNHCAQKADRPHCPLAENGGYGSDTRGRVENTRNRVIRPCFRIVNCRLRDEFGLDKRYCFGDVNDKGRTSSETHSNTVRASAGREVSASGSLTH